MPVFQTKWKVNWMTQSDFSKGNSKCSVSNVSSLRHCGQTGSSVFQAEYQFPCIARFFKQLAKSEKNHTFPVMEICQTVMICHSWARIPGRWWSQGKLEFSLDCLDCLNSLQMDITQHRVNPSSLLDLSASWIMSTEKTWNKKQANRIKRVQNKLHCSCCREVRSSTI